MNDDSSIVPVHSQEFVLEKRNMRKNQPNADIAKKRVRAETVTWSPDLVPCVAMVSVDNTSKKQNSEEIVIDIKCNEANSPPTLSKSMRKKMNARKRAAEKLENDEESAKRMKTDKTQGIEIRRSSNVNIGDMDIDSALTATTTMASNDTSVSPADDIRNTNTAVSSSHLDTDIAPLTPISLGRTAANTDTNNLSDKTIMISNKSTKMITTITPLNIIPNKQFAAAVAAAAMKLEAAALLKLKAADASKLEAAASLKLETAAVLKLKAADASKLEAAAVITATSAAQEVPTGNGKTSKKKSNTQKKNEVANRNETPANNIISCAIDSSTDELMRNDLLKDISVDIITDLKPTTNMKKNILLAEKSSFVRTIVVVDKSNIPVKILSSDSISIPKVVASVSTSTTTSLNTAKEIGSPALTSTPKLKVIIEKTKPIPVATKQTKLKTDNISVVDTKIPLEVEVEVATLPLPVIQAASTPTSTSTSTPVQSKNSRKKLNARKKLELSLITDPIAAAKVLTEKAAEVQKAAMANYVKQKMESDAQNNMKYRPAGSSSAFDAVAVAADFQLKFGENNSNQNHGNALKKEKEKDREKEKEKESTCGQNQNQSQKATKLISSSSSKAGKYGPPSNIKQSIQTNRNKIDLRKSIGFDKYTYHNQSYGQTSTPYVTYSNSQYNGSQFLASNLPNNQYQSNTSSEVAPGLLGGGNQLYNRTMSNISSYPNPNQIHGRVAPQVHRQETQASQYNRYAPSQVQPYVHPNPQSYNVNTGNNVGYSNQMDGAGSTGLYGSSASFSGVGIYPTSGVIQNTIYQSPQQQQQQQQQQSSYQPLLSMNMNTYLYSKSTSTSPTHSSITTTSPGIYGQGQAYSSIDSYQNIPIGIPTYQSNSIPTSQYSNAASLSPYNSNFIPSSVYQSTPSLYTTTVSSTSNPYSHGINSK